jgi:hypothetical protein
LLRTPGASAKLAPMQLPLATDEGVSVLLVMLAVGLIFLTVIALGELTHALGHRRKQRRRARRRAY